MIPDASFAAMGVPENASADAGVVDLEIEGSQYPALHKVPEHGAGRLRGGALVSEQLELVAASCAAL